jgi:hypothetical protein
MRIRLEFKLADFWIGVFWKVTKTEPVCHCGDLMTQHSMLSGHDAVEMPQPDLLDIWICILPCLPIHVQAYIESTSGIEASETEI